MKCNWHLPWCMSVETCTWWFQTRTGRQRHRLLWRRTAAADGRTLVRGISSDSHLATCYLLAAVGRVTVRKITCAGTITNNNVGLADYVQEFRPRGNQILPERILVYMSWHLFTKKLISRWDDERELFATTSYTYNEIQKKEKNKQLSSC